MSEPYARLWELLKQQQQQLDADRNTPAAVAMPPKADVNTPAPDNAPSSDTDTA